MLSISYSFTLLSSDVGDGRIRGKDNVKDRKSPGCQKSSF